MRRAAAVLVTALVGLHCTAIVGIDKDYTAAPADAGGDGPVQSGDLQITPATTRLVLHQGESKDLSVEIQRGAVQGAVNVTVNKLPPNVTASPLVIVPGETRGTIHLSAAPNAPIGPVDASVVASSGTIIATSTVTLAMIGAPGGLDGSFGANGIGSIAVGGKFFTGLARTSQGRILLGGATSTQLVAVAVSSNGAIDGPFGAGGVAKTTVGTNTLSGGAILGAGDAFVVGGTADVSALQQAVVTRFTSSGAVDTGFGSSGMTVFNAQGNATGINALAAGPNDTIVAAGFVVQAGQKTFAVGRYTSAGAVDPAFAGGSFKAVDLPGSGEEARGVAVLPDGSIVAVGQTSLSATTTSDFAIVRFTSAGDVDTSFGTGGVVTVDFGAFEDGARAIAVQPDGAIVVVGFTRGPSAGTTADVALVRLLPSGAIDPAFTKRTYPVGPSDDIATAVAIQTDGRILALAETNSSAGIPNLDFALLRCQPDGALDPQFGLGGKVVTDFGGAADHPRAILLVGDTQILAAGHDDTGSALVARYWQ